MQSKIITESIILSILMTGTDLNYTVANFLTCVDSQIRIAYLSSDDELKEKYMKDLQEIELALYGIGDLNKATEEYVDKKSHEL